MIDLYRDIEPLTELYRRRLQDLRDGDSLIIRHLKEEDFRGLCLEEENKEYNIRGWQEEDSQLKYCQRLEFRNGSVYRGCLKSDGERYRIGVLEQDDGGKYWGEWKDNAPNGYGVYSDSKQKYEGYFVNFEY